MFNFIKKRKQIKFEKDMKELYESSQLIFMEDGDIYELIDSNYKTATYRSVLNDELICGPLITEQDYGYMNNKKTLSVIGTRKMIDWTNDGGAKIAGLLWDINKFTREYLNYKYYNYFYSSGEEEFAAHFLQNTTKIVLEEELNELILDSVKQYSEDLAEEMGSRDAIFLEKINDYIDDIDEDDKQQIKEVQEEYCLKKTEHAFVVYMLERFLNDIENIIKNESKDSSCEEESDELDDDFDVVFPK